MADDPPRRTGSFSSAGMCGSHHQREEDPTKYGHRGGEPEDGRFPSPSWVLGTEPSAVGFEVGFPKVRSHARLLFLRPLLAVVAVSAALRGEVALDLPGLFRQLPVLGAFGIQFAFE